MKIIIVTTANTTDNDNYCMQQQHISLHRFTFIGADFPLL